MKVNFNQILIKDKEWTLNLITSLVQCKICLNILNNPHDCLCCNQTFCKKCITNYINTNKKCPYSSYFRHLSSDDSKPIEADQVKHLLASLHPSSSNLVNSINTLTFACEYRKNGCSKELSLDEVNVHSKECKHQKGSPLPRSSHNNSMSIDRLDSLTNSTKDKFKFNDSCMSFRKVEVSDASSPYGGHQQQFNQRMMEKMDKMYELISAMTVSTESKRSTSRKLSTKLSLTKIISIQTEDNPHSHRNSTDKDMHKSPQKAKENKQTSSKGQKSPGNSQKDIAMKLDKVLARIGALERIVQTVSSMSTQEYSIATEDLLSSTIASTPKKNKEKERELYKTIIPMNNNRDSLNSKLFNSSFATSTSKQESTSNRKRKLLFSNQLISAQKNNSISHKPLNSSMSSTGKAFHARKDKGDQDQPVNATQLLKGNDMSKIEEMLNEKVSSMKAYIEEKCIDELRKYFLELTLDNSNLFVQKIDEVITLLPSSNNSNTSSNDQSAQPNVTIT